MVTLIKYGNDENDYSFDVKTSDGRKMTFYYEYVGTSIEEIKDLLKLLGISYFEVFRN